MPNGRSASNPKIQNERCAIAIAIALPRTRGVPIKIKERRSLVQAPNAPRDQSQHPRARNDYDEEAAYESYMNPEPGFQSGPGDSVDAD